MSEAESHNRRRTVGFITLATFAAGTAIAGGVAARHRHNKHHDEAVALKNSASEIVFSDQNPLTAERLRTVFSPQDEASLPDAVDG